jgi:hypothetical protein
MTLSLGAAWMLSLGRCTKQRLLWLMAVMVVPQASGWLYAMTGVTETPPP